MCYGQRMKPLRLLLASALLIAAPVAQAQVIVVGNGDAQLCYQSAKTGNSGTPGAIRTCTNALEEEVLSRRDEAATFVNRGVLLMRSGDQRAAETDYLSALAIDDRLPEAHINYGVSLFQQGRIEASLAAYNTALDLKAIQKDDKLAAMTLFNRALTHERLGNPKAAYYDFKSASERQPDWELPRDALTRFTVTRRAAS